MSPTWIVEDERHTQYRVDAIDGANAEKIVASQLPPGAKLKVYCTCRYCGGDSGDFAFCDDKCEYRFNVLMGKEG